MASDSNAAAEALARAKAIAARLSGQSVAGGTAAAAAAAAAPTGSASASATDTSSATATATATTTGKRKRWGVQPPGLAAAAPITTASTATATATSGVLPDPSLKRPKETPPAAAETKRIWVSTSEVRPPQHYVIFLKDKLSDIINKVRSSPDSSLSIALKGRGSSSEPPIPGMPEQPLHVLVQGSKAEIDAADTQVDILLREAEQVEPLATAEDIDNSQALTTLGGGQNSNNNNNAASSAYRPASVAQMIGQANLPPETATSDWIPSEVQVPNGVVGFLIGRGGENISSMQARTGCKVQIQKEHELTAGQTQRTIYLQAPHQQALDDCKEIILKMVREKSASYGHSSGATTTTAHTTNTNMTKDERLLQEALQAGHHHIPLDVPDADVGLIIGKQGSTIRSIQEQSGASIQVPHSTGNATTRTLNITHPTQQGAEHAKQLVQNILATKVQHHSSGGGGEQVTIQVAIPDKDVGLCIGRQGCVIREMQSKTRTRIQIPSHPIPGETHRTASVTGPKEGCEQVKAMIESISAAQSSAPVMSGTYNQHQQHQPHGYGGHYGHQAPQLQQQQQQQQQQQYSAEWAAYHAAQAAAQQQQQHAQPAPAPAVPAPAATQQQSASDAYYEQFFRYAYYYGEDAARKYYGAWSPPVGTPNPYGVNPNGTAPAAAAPAAATPAPVAPAPVAPALVAPVDTRALETGRRKVSNLPAWMTKGQQ